MKGGREYLILAPLFLILLFLQESFLWPISLFRGLLSVYLLLFFFLIFFRGKGKEMGIAFVAGLVLDFFSFLPFGVFAFSFALSVFLLKKAEGVFRQQPRFSVALFLP